MVIVVNVLASHTEDSGSMTYKREKGRHMDTRTTVHCDAKRDEKDKAEQK